MAVSAHLRYILYSSFVFILAVAQISNLRLCADAECKAQISEGRTLLRYHSSDPQILSFPINSPVKIYSKSAGSNRELWGAVISDRRGYVPLKFVRERKVLIPMSELKFEVPTESLPSANEKPVSSRLDDEKISSTISSQDDTSAYVQSSWTKSATALTEGIHTIATFTNEFPASLDKLSTKILNRVFTSAETISTELVENDETNLLDETVSIDNVTSSLIEASTTQVVLPSEQKESEPIRSSLVNEKEELVIADQNESEEKSLQKQKLNFSLFLCDLAEIQEICVYNFGSVLARTMMSKIEPEKVNNQHSNKQNMPETKAMKSSESHNEEEEEDDDDDDAEFDDEEDSELVESSESESIEEDKGDKKVETEKSSLMYPPVQTQFEDKMTASSSELFATETDLRSQLDFKNIEVTQSEVDEGDSSDFSNVDVIQSKIDEEISSDFSNIDVTQPEVDERDSSDFSNVEVTQSQVDEGIGSDLNNIEVTQSQVDEGIGSDLNNIEVTQSEVDKVISSGLNNIEVTQSEVDKGISSGLNNIEVTQSEVDKGISSEFNNIKVSWSKVDENEGDSSIMNDDEFSTVRIYIDSFGQYLQLIIDSLPESLRMTLHEQMKMGVSPRATVLTTITGFVLVLFLSMYFIIKRGSRERDLIARLCNVDRKLFAVTAERDVLKENVRVSSETVVNYEEKYTKIDEELVDANEQLVSIKEENDALQSIVDELKAERKSLQNCSITFKTDCEEKDKFLAELEEENRITKENCKELEEQVDSLQEELHVKLKNHVDNEQRIISLSDQITRLQQSNCQLLQEAQVWNQRMQELQQQIESMSERNEELESRLLTKDKEIEILKDAATQLESLESEDDSETKSEKLQKLFDVSAISAELKTALTKQKALQEDYDAESSACINIRTQLDAAIAENELLKQRDGELKRERDDAVTKLHVLSDYFKEKEIELQKELGVQEAMRQQTEESALSVTEKAELYEKEVKLHRSHIEALKKEMDNQIRSYKTQITLHESKSHENWLAARAAERRAEEAKQESAILRNKLTNIEQEKEATNRLQTEETRIRRYAGSNGEANSPPPRLDNEASERAIQTPPSIGREGLDVNRRIPFLPLDRPLPPPPPSFLGDRMPILGPRPPFDLPPPPMIPYDRLPIRDFLPPPGRRPPSPPMFNRRFPPGPGRYVSDRDMGGIFRDTSPPPPPRFHDRPNFPHKLPSDAQFGGGVPARFPSPFSGPLAEGRINSPLVSRKNTSPPSDIGNTSSNTSV